MSQIKSYLDAAAEKTGVEFIGLERKDGVIRNGIGSTVEDILGWNIIVRDKDGSCHEYYTARPPLIGMTQPVPIRCPLGIVSFDGYKIDIEEAVKIFHTQNGGDKFVEVSLSWPLTHPEAPEPYWYFRTNLGNNVVIGANSGQIKGYSPIVVLYMAQPK
ncbi:hypothetical protein [Sulfurimonas sp.]|uniref:hypothetical protein n=1 Tax=Sulfurimonas sp. TaxID=2022749 RepID=UPI003D0E9361